MIPFLAFTRKFRRYRKPIEEAVTRVFKRGWFILGSELREFEAAFARYLDVKYVIGVNSGTDALFLALKAHGIGPAHEVITVANTAVPTVSAIRMTGAMPVFVDVQQDTHTLDPSLLERSINSRTIAILPVHLYGYPASMKEINRIAKKHGLIVIEDACQAHGAKYGDQKVGTFGNAGCFSFYPTKNLGAFGDAGAVATNSKRIADNIKAMRNYGEIAKNENVYEGVNTRMDELQAALLKWGIRHLDKWNLQRAKIASRYSELLSNAPLELPLPSDSMNERVWHLFVVKTSRRNELQKFLFQHGIETAIHYPTPIYKQHAYRFLRYTPKDLPVTTQLSNRILSLPLHPELTMAEVSRVCGCILKFYGSRN